MESSASTTGIINATTETSTFKIRKLAHILSLPILWTKVLHEGELKKLIRY
ncbi:MAG TPA: hypothetical protein VKT28_09270 [Puia sp.]|nr:hypothetical protein [Puia sp.]